MHNFFRVKRHYGAGDVSPWGENEHGFFNMSDGRFIPKGEDEKGYGSFDQPDADLTWPGESTEKREE